MAIAAIAAIAIAMVLAIRTGVITVFEAKPHPETERFTERSDQPLQLLGELQSYHSVVDVEQALAPAGYDIETVERPLAGTPERPPRNITTLYVWAYRYCGSSGTLTLSFMNDRLFEALFEPADAAACADALARQSPSLERDVNGRAEWIDGDRRLATNVWLSVSDVGQAIGSQAWVIGQDLRLIRQYREWEQRFARSASARAGEPEDPG